jgi:hypothetical protein
MPSDGRSDLASEVIYLCDRHGRPLSLLSWHEREDSLHFFASASKTSTGMPVNVATRISSSSRNDSFGLA